MVFDTAVRVAVPAGPLTDKEHVRRLIAGIEAGSTTNLSGGLLRGVAEARRVSGDRGATLLLLSDGHANQGVVDHDALGRIGASGRNAGISVSTIGIGLGYDEQLLAIIARAGAGNTHFAEHADDAGAAVASEVDDLLDQVVQAATLRYS